MKDHYLRLFRSIWLIINYKTVIITLLSLLSTYLCFTYGAIARFPETLVGVAIVFPVVFSISSAYARRENALQKLSEIKGHVVAIYFASRDWVADNEKDRYHKKMKSFLKDMLHHLAVTLSRQDHKEWKKNEKKMYRYFSELSIMTLKLRGHGIESGEMSRIAQYVSKIIISFDNVKSIHRYRTPITLRAYSKVFIYLFPIIYGPFFASMLQEFSFLLGYFMPVLYSFILVSLDNIQDQLENPFDEFGEDDIDFEDEKTVILKKA